MIIVEGMDATGKSTLIEKIQVATGWPVYKSGGPEKYPGEILDRCVVFKDLPEQVICDRHPVISQQVYSKINGTTPITPMYIEMLKVRRPLVIYASGTNRGEHQIKEGEDLEYVKKVDANREIVEKEYLRVMRDCFDPHYIIYQWMFQDAVVKYAVNYAKQNGGLIV